MSVGVGSFAVEDNRYELVADDSAMLLEGEFAGGRVVIVEFPFVSEMKAWQATPEYLEAAKIRSAATHTLDDPRQFIRAAYHLRVDIAAIPADSRMHTVPVPLVEEQRFRIQ